jgi:hypothetical protein
MDFDRLAVLEDVGAGWSHNDHYLTVSGVRRVCWMRLPGALIRKHLFWRYSLLWQRPVQSIQAAIRIG